MPTTPKQPAFADQTYAGVGAPISSAPTLVQMQTAIETRLKTISGLRTSPYISEQVNPPMAVVGVPDIPSYHKAFHHGLQELDFTVILCISKASDRFGQLNLGEYADIAGDLSIHAAIEADKTLGGIVDDAICASFRRLSSEEVGAIGYYGGEFIIRVLAKGN